MDASLGPVWAALHGARLNCRFNRKRHAVPAIIVGISVGVLQCHREAMGSVADSYPRRFEVIASNASRRTDQFP